MEESLARAYRKLWHEHWWWRARREILLAKLAALAPAGGWRRILDVGCGDGLFFDDLLALGADVRGVEPDARIVSESGPHAGRIHLGPFVGPSGSDRPFVGPSGSDRPFVGPSGLDRPFDDGYAPDEPFDLVLLLDVLEHLDDRVACLRRARELLAPGGRILITVPAFPVLWTNHDVLSHHRLRYTRRSLVDEVTAAGLVPREVRALFRWLSPVKLAVRIAETLVHRTPRPPAVPPAWLNRLALALSRLDERALGRLPFGSSLLCVCETDESRLET